MTPPAEEEDPPVIPPAEDDPPAPPPPSAAVPGAPTIGTATVSGDTEATVTFTAPASPGGSAITGYIVTSTPSGFTGTGAASPITVTGLENTSDTSYTFVVQAINIYGSGPASAASNSVTPVVPATVPQAPIIGTATTGVSHILMLKGTNNIGNETSFIDTVVVGAATIENSGFEAPVLQAASYVNAPPGVDWSFLGGSGIQRNGSLGAATAPAGQQTAFLYGGTAQISQTFYLAAGSYTVSFYAARRNLGIQPIQVSLDEIPIGSAITPTGDSFALYTTDSFTVVGDTQALVRFTAPVADGGAAITGYTATSSPGGVTGTGSASPITVSGLTNGTAYTFTVTATNSVGTSAASSASNSVTPAPAPAPTPTISVSPTTAAPLETVTVTWSDIPFPTPGDWIALYSPLDGDTPGSWGESWLYINSGTQTAGVSADADGSVDLTLLSYLPDGDYEVRLFTNDTRTRLATSNTLTVEALTTVPGAPTAVVGTAGVGQVSVTGTAPASDGGSAITGYVADDGMGGHITSAGARPRIVTGLTPTVAITPRLAAVNTNGQGPWGTAALAVTPTAPTGVDFSTTFGLTTTAASATYPFSIGLGFGEGDVPASIALSGLVGAQVTAKRTWNDGSLKHAIVSGRAALTQNVVKTITITLGTTSGGAALVAADIATAAPTASVQCGAIGTVTLTSLLASPFATWVSGSEMVECHYRAMVGADANLTAWFHVRLFADGRMWVRAICENGYLDNGSGALAANVNKSYIPTMVVGGVTVYNNGGATYLNCRNTRYCAEGWIGGDPVIHPAQDKTYLISTKLVPNYFFQSPSETALNALLQVYTPGSNGMLTPTMGQGGYQQTIGILPLFDAMYCTTADKRARASALANSSHLNSYGIVWRDRTTNLVPKPATFPTWSVFGPGGAGSGEYVISNGLQWESSHAGSSGYLAYLITGDYWHYETMLMHCSLCYLIQGAGSGSGLTRNLNPGQIRAGAWQQRTIGQLAGIAPDGDAIAAEYRTLVSNDIASVYGYTTAPGASQLGWPFAISTYNESLPLSAPPWMYNFWISTLGHLVDIEPFATMTTVTALSLWMNKAIVGMLGANGAANYCFNRANQYTVTISDDIVANYATTTPDRFYATWGEVWENTFGAPNNNCTNTLDTANGPLNSTSYFAWLLPAISSAVDHGAPGAVESFARLTGSDQWTTWTTATGGAGFHDIPHWGILPRNYGSSTLTGNQWTPAKDATGYVTDSEWNGLPLNTWIEWIGTALTSQLSAPYGTAGFTELGNISAHLVAYTGAAFDETNGRFYHFGGGHNDGSNNMLTEFDCAKGTWRVVIPPTPNSMYPTGYAAAGTWSPIDQYGSSESAEYTSSWTYFPSGNSPVGDNKPCCAHAYSGMVFVPGINEILMGRFGWYHARLDTSAWRVGPQVAFANRVGFTKRGGISQHAHYLASTGLVYLMSEGSQISQNEGYYNIVKYNPVTRTETGVIAWNYGFDGSASCIDEAGILWYLHLFEAKVAKVDLPSSTSLWSVQTDPHAITGRIPGYGSTAQYVSDLDKILVWSTSSRSGGANSGEMVEFNRTTAACTTFPVVGTPPAPTGEHMNNKMRYWPEKKVMLFQTATNVNCYVIRLA